MFDKLKESLRKIFGTAEPILSKKDIEVLEAIETTEGVRLFEALLGCNSIFAYDIVMNENLSVLANKLLKQNMQTLIMFGCADKMLSVAKNIPVDFRGKHPNIPALTEQVCSELKTFQDTFVETLPQLGRSDVYMAYLPFITLLTEQQQEKIMWGVKSQGTEFIKGYLMLIYDYNTDSPPEAFKIEKSAQRILLSDLEQSDITDLIGAGLNKEIIDDIRQVPMPKRPASASSHDPMFG
ncbi:MAG: hypothetical protein LBN07_01980 [Christensenellaceae bacterium]|jgi:hypothetical protein|nr:hypothetical protein [Christensenellaceae bacterium]